ncbi:hypothetical protein ACFLRB_03905 [Acidobacteriota bacterium]
MRKTLTILLIIFLAVNVVSCSKNSRDAEGYGLSFIEENKKIPKKKILKQSEIVNLKDITITGSKVYDQSYVGFCNMAGEFYTCNYLYDIDNSKIAVMIRDTLTGKVKKELIITRGDSQSPSMVEEKVFWAKRINDKYILYDKNKFLVYDLNCNWLYSSFLQKKLNVVDYDLKDGEIKLIGSYEWLDQKNLITNHHVSVFSLNRLKRSEEDYQIDSFTTQFHHLWVNRDENHLNIFHFFPKLTLFTQNNNTFYMLNSIKKCYVYNNRTKEYRVLDLSYLELLEYSPDEVLDIAKLSGTFEVFRKLNAGTKHNYKFNFVQHPCATFSFFILDAGENKLGIAADLDPKVKKIRVDFFKAIEGEYSYSLNLPLPRELLKRLGMESSLFSPVYVNLDLGIYIYNDFDPDGNDIVKYIKFTVNK